MTSTRRLAARRLVATAAVLACAAGAALATPAAAQEKVLKASDVHPLGYPTVEAVVRMGEKLEEATGGRLGIQMYPAGQLGGEKEMIEQAQVGALDLARISVGPVGTVVDALNVFNLPFVFRDEEHMRKVIDGEIGEELFQMIMDSPDTKLVPLAWMDAGSRSIYADKPVRTPEDLQGLKIRMMGNPIFVDTLNAMGGNGISMGFNELYSALQTGVVDGAENNPPTFLTHNHYQVAGTYSLTEHLIIPEILVMSRRTWDSLSPEDQELLRKLGREAQQEQRQLWDEMTEKSVAELKEKGVTFVEDVDKEAFKESVKPVYDKYGEQYAELLERIEAVQ